MEKGIKEKESMILLDIIYSLEKNCIELKDSFISDYGIIKNAKDSNLIPCIDDTYVRIIATERVIEKLNSLPKEDKEL